MSAFKPEPSSQLFAAATLSSVFNAIEGAGVIAAQLIIQARGDEQTIRLLHDLINDLCVARLGTQLLQASELCKPELVTLDEVR